MDLLRKKKMIDRIFLGLEEIKEILIDALPRTRSCLDLRLPSSKHRNKKLCLVWYNKTDIQLQNSFA